MTIAIALVPMLAWGSIGLISGKLGGDANQQTLGMTLGALLLSLLTFFAVDIHMTWWICLIGIISGLFWTVGQNGQFHGMKYLGVSVGLPVSTGMQLCLNTLAGAVFFHEWTQTKQYIFGLLALLFLVLGAYSTARQEKKSSNEENNDVHFFKKGLRALLISTLGYGCYTILITWAKLDPLAIILPQSTGMVIGALWLALGKTKINHFVWKNMVSGLVWGIGNICLLISVQKIGLAIAFSMSQMGIVISTLGGIFILGETKTKKELHSVLVGCACVVIGGLILGYMKTL